MGRRRKAYIMKFWGVKVGELPRREERNKGLGGGLVWWGRAFGGFGGFEEGVLDDPFFFFLAMAVSGGLE